MKASPSGKTTPPLKITGEGREATELASSSFNLSWEPTTGRPSLPSMTSAAILNLLVTDFLRSRLPDCERNELLTSIV